VKYEKIPINEKSGQNLAQFARFGTYFFFMIRYELASRCPVDELLCYAWYSRNCCFGCASSVYDMRFCSWWEMLNQWIMNKDSTTLNEMKCR
jgi:hypothetical protein